MNEPATILDDLLAVLAARPARVHWQRPAIFRPVFIECAEALRDCGYSVVTAVVDGDAHLVARHAVNED